MHAAAFKPLPKVILFLFLSVIALLVCADAYLLYLLWRYFGWVLS